MLTEMGFCILGQATMNAINFWNFLKLFEAIDMDGSFPTSRYM
jgi:hypothetical protein